MYVSCADLFQFALVLFVPALSENKKIAAPSQRFAATFSSSYLETGPAIYRQALFFYVYSAGKSTARYSPWVFTRVAACSRAAS